MTSAAVVVGGKDRAGRDDWMIWLLPALLGTLVSMVRIGQTSGRWNNFFHLPILSGLSAMPQFADDAFVQSLTHYSSGFWQIFASRVPYESVPTSCSSGRSSRASRRCWDFSHAPICSGSGVSGKD